RWLPEPQRLRHLDHRPLRRMNTDGLTTNARDESRAHLCLWRYSAASAVTPDSPSCCRASSRSTSIGFSLPSASKCQNVHPLQAAAPCTTAPIRWIDPCCAPIAVLSAAFSAALDFFTLRAAAAPGRSPRGSDASGCANDFGLRSEERRVGTECRTPW